jgi:hypothetical protein
VDYLALANIAFKILLPFPTTYECELHYSSLHQITTAKYRNRLSMKGNLRLALASPSPRIKKLVGENQAQSSR